MFNGKKLKMTKTTFIKTKIIRMIVYLFLADSKKSTPVNILRLLAFVFFPNEMDTSKIACGKDGDHSNYSLDNILILKKGSYRNKNIVKDENYKIKKMYVKTISQDIIDYINELYTNGITKYETVKEMVLKHKNTIISSSAFYKITTHHRPEKDIRFSKEQVNQICRYLELGVRSIHIQKMVDFTISPDAICRN